MKNDGSVVDLHFPLIIHLESSLMIFTCESQGTIMYFKVLHTHLEVPTAHLQSIDD